MNHKSPNKTIIDSASNKIALRSPRIATISLSWYDIPYLWIKITIIQASIIINYIENSKIKIKTQ